MGEQNEHMELTVGAVVEGKVKSLTKFGAFVALPDGSTGMVHISEIAHAYVNDIREHLTEGQDVKVMIISRENGKTNLSIKRTLPAPSKPQFSRPQSRSFNGGAQRNPGQSGERASASGKQLGCPAAAEVVRRYAQAVYDGVEQQNVLHQAVFRAQDKDQKKMKLAPFFRECPGKGRLI